MLTIIPINAFNDNYIWALINESTQQLIVVDPGQAQPVLAFIEEKQLTLTDIWITHKHHDHVGGIKQLLEANPGVNVFAHSMHTNYVTHEVEEGSSLHAFGESALSVDLWLIPGHTENHLAYVLNMAEQYHVFCGDTLFSAGCGRVFTGDMQAMHLSLERFKQLPDNTLFYPAHEYTASNLQFGLHIEPNNVDMQQHLALALEAVAQGKPSLPTRLDKEKSINVFLRTHKESVVQSVAEKATLKTTHSLAIFSALRQLKDNF